MRRAVRGSAAFVLPGKVQSVLAGPTYATGSPWSWAGARQFVAAHPIATAAVAVIAAHALAAAWFLRRRARRRA
jgi:hypothetical protein